MIGYDRENGKKRKLEDLYFFILLRFLLCYCDDVFSRFLIEAHQPENAVTTLYTIKNFIFILNITFKSNPLI